MLPEKLNQIIICFAAVLAVVGIVTAIIKAITLKQKSEFEKEIASLGYKEGMSNEFTCLFGNPSLWRTRSSSRQLVSNFSKEECRLKYMQKYFGLKLNDETVDHLENVIKWIRALEKLYRENPKYKKFAEDLYPVFSMEYVSPAGKSSADEVFVFTKSNTRQILAEVQNLLSAKQFKKIQRSAMTPKLREAVLKRDNWTCQCCGNSVFLEPNLLLEVDHIVPVSAGGKTEPSNLQTLCWKCNRAKSDRI